MSMRRRVSDVRRSPKKSHSGGIHAQISRLPSLVHRHRRRQLSLGRVRVRPERPGCSAAQAQADQTQGLEEVVVVARRTEERLQDVPVTVTAISSQVLKQTQITQGTDLIKLIPTLSVHQGATGPGVTYALRGIHDGVITYFNDVFTTSSATEDQIWDLQSIQGLAGPQGTLFGASATGGAILFEAQRPTKKSWKVSSTVSYGNYNFRAARPRVINVPVNDQLQLRFGGHLDQARRHGATTSAAATTCRPRTATSFRASVPVPADLEHHRLPGGRL